MLILKVGKTEIMYCKNSIQIIEVEHVSAILCKYLHNFLQSRLALPNSLINIDLREKDTPKHTLQ